MTDNLTVNFGATRAEGSADEVRITSDSGPSIFAPERLPRRVPLFIPRNQAYYWTREWQEGEVEADEELRRGEARAFDNVEDALRWLDSPED